MSVAGTAPAKAILVGEHAVVFGHPAIAIPVSQARARAEARFVPQRPAGWVRIEAPAVGLHASLAELDAQHPLAALLRLALQEFALQDPPAFELRIESTIPVAAGMGSSAAVSVAVLRALSRLFERPLSPQRICALAFEVEKIHHGTPSGIDNTVITLERPILFVRGQEPVTLAVARPLTFLLAHTGVESSTAEAVARVRRAHEIYRQATEKIFERMRGCVEAALDALGSGDLVSLGQAMNRNQRALRDLRLDIPQSAALVSAALEAGALGAKITGAGLGGNVIALVDDGQVQRVATAMQAAGAQRVIQTRIEP